MKRKNSDEQEQSLWDDLRVSLTLPNLTGSLKSEKQELLYGFLRKDGAHNFQSILSNRSRYFINGWEIQKM